MLCLSAFAYLDCDVENVVCNHFCGFGRSPTFPSPMIMRMMRCTRCTALFPRLFLLLRLLLVLLLLLLFGIGIPFGVEVNCGVDELHVVQPRQEVVQQTLTSNLPAGWWG